MDLTREALEFIQRSNEPAIINHMGNSYSDKELYKIDNYSYPVPLKVSTLQALADYMNSGIDGDLVSMFLVVIDSPTQVKLLSEVDDDMNRMHLFSACAGTPDIKFGSFIDRELFNIQLQSCFANTEDRALLLDIISNIEAGTIAEYTDDGFAQKANIKRGAKYETAKMPNPVTLAPYRSFPEIEQVPSNFVFRLREDDGRIECGLFPADGGAWQLESRQRIKDWLISALSPHVYDNTVILA